VGHSLPQEALQVLLPKRSSTSPKSDRHSPAFRRAEVHETASRSWCSKPFRTRGCPLPNSAMSPHSRSLREWEPAASLGGVLGRIKSMGSATNVRCTRPRCGGNHSPLNRQRLRAKTWVLDFRAASALVGSALGIGTTASPRAPLSGPTRGERISGRWWSKAVARPRLISFPIEKYKVTHVGPRERLRRPWGRHEPICPGYAGRRRRRSNFRGALPRCQPTGRRWSCPRRSPRPRVSA
jgi:hypothetical protein